MTCLPLANVLHHKLRSFLSALAVAIGVGMLITMLSLSHGTLGEVSNRVKSVQAELIVLPSRSSLIFSEGAPLSDKFIARIQSATVGGRAAVKRVVPVFISLAPEMAGQQQRVFGIDPDDFDVFAGGRRFKAGTGFDRRFKVLIEKLRNQKGRYDPSAVSEEQLARACQMIIDDRLAAAGGYRVGDTVSFLGRDFRICGIVERGVAGRVLVPIQVLRHIQTAGLERSSLFFVQLAEGVKEAAGKKAIERVTRLQVASLSNYDQLLFRSFESIYAYINIASGVALVVSFLFILVTVYTMVLERTREIGILRALGAGDLYILYCTVAEALIISLTGTAMGVALAYASKHAIETYRPLLTVAIEGRWLLLAALVGVAGGLVSAIYPGYRAVRQDPVAALSFE